MATIVYKSLNPTQFRLSNNKVIYLAVGGVLNFISDTDYTMLMNEYGDFILKRVLSDKNPHGCFILSDKAINAKAQSNEVGDEFKDNSAPIKVKRGRKAKK